MFTSSSYLLAVLLFSLRFEFSSSCLPCEMLPLKEAQAKRYLDPAGKLQCCLGYIGKKKVL